MKDKIEELLNLEDPEIKSLYNSWDKGDCSDVGLCEILLYQLIKEHKESNGEFYDKDYDQIQLRYGKKETNNTSMLNFIKSNNKTEIDINTCIMSGKHKSELDYVDGEWICLNCGNIC
jgi:hypothetical protein